MEGFLVSTACCLFCVAVLLMITAGFAKECYNQCNMANETTGKYSYFTYMLVLGAVAILLGLIALYPGLTYEYEC
jgi:hypothetical protein